ncbi:wax ester/triacylglycerol synthase family O-acyltransferase [Actinoplanes sp. NPDC049265]|uniref:wax ester/triacylglycerol synthase family O-acyltransferase n=1 Tax=Actinoplanes sp. NPDC049265 TaxID=3363902 RepID=UPI00371F2338
MDYLSPLDAAFLDAEDGDPHASLAIASIAVADGPAPSAAAFTAAVRGRLPLVPRYRQKVRRLPLNLGLPVWVDDPGFDLDFHLRRTALAAPGDDAALGRLIGRIMSHRLDRERPLWEYWLIEGLPEGRWAVLSKVHHCMVDGMTGNELYRIMCDPTPEPRPPVPDHWHPSPDGDRAGLTLDALRRLAALPFEQLRWIARGVRDPAATVRRARDTWQGVRALAEAITPGRPTSLSGPLGLPRRYAFARIPFIEIRSAARRHKVTVNDVYLAAVAGAFRRLMLDRDEEPAADAIRTLVPVNVRPDGDTTIANRIVSLLVQLPVEVADPVERLAVVHRRIAELRGSHEIETGAALLELADHEPFAAVALGVRTALRLPQRAIVTVTTNVPGPPGQLYLLGHPIREILPYVPIAERMRIGVSVLTYGGQAAIGVTADFASVPEAGTFPAGIVAEIRALTARPTRPTADLV